jgi:polyketide synthase PksL
MTKEEIKQILKAEINKETGLPLGEIEDNSDFFSLGMDSISCVYVLDRVEKKLNMELNPIYFFDYPTIDLLSGYVATLKRK